MEALARYIIRVGIAFSMFVNVILGGPLGQTFSARNYQWKVEKRLNIVFLIDLFFLIFAFQRHHCRKSWCKWKENG